MYWIRVLILGTGEIIDMGRGYTSEERARKAVAGLIRERDFDDPDEIYEVVIYDKPGYVRSREHWPGGEFKYTNSNPDREPLHTYRVRRDQIEGAKSSTRSYPEWWKGQGGLPRDE